MTVSGHSAKRFWACMSSKI